MASKGPGRTGAAWLRLRDRVLAEEFDCRRCGKPLHPELPWPHPWSSAVDHLVALEDGGAELDRANLGAVHMRCNSAKENTQRRVRRLRASREW